MLNYYRNMCWIVAAPNKDPTKIVASYFYNFLGYVIIALFCVSQTHKIHKLGFEQANCVQPLRGESSVIPPPNLW